MFKFNLAYVQNLFGKFFTISLAKIKIPLAIEFTQNLPNFFSDSIHLGDFFIC